MIINTTPHLIRFQRASDGGVFEVEPCGVVLNATPQEFPCGKHSSGAELVKVVFGADEANTAKLEQLERENPDAVIIGSIIAAQAFPGRVLAMVPVPEFERVPTDQKRMRDDKFTTF